MVQNTLVLSHSKCFMEQIVNITKVWFYFHFQIRKYLIVFFEVRQNLSEGQHADTVLYWQTPVDISGVHNPTQLFKIKIYKHNLEEWTKQVKLALR